MIRAVEIKPQIYLDESIDLNELFNKIKPNQISLNSMEKKYIEEKKLSPSSIVWTTYQHLIKLSYQEDDFRLKKIINSIELAIHSYKSKKLQEMNLENLWEEGKILLISD